MGKAAASTSVFALLQDALQESIWPRVSAWLSGALALAVVCFLAFHFWPGPKPDAAALDSQTSVATIASETAVINPPPKTAPTPPAPAPKEPIALPGPGPLAPAPPIPIAGATNLPAPAPAVLPRKPVAAPSPNPGGSSPDQIAIASSAPSQDIPGTYTVYYRERAALVTNNEGASPPIEQAAIPSVQSPKYSAPTKKR